MPRTSVDTGPDSRYVPAAHAYGFTTFADGQINFPMVMHNAHQRAKAERNGWIEFAKSNPGYVVKSYREYFAVELRDQMRDAHSMSAWKRGNGVKVDADFIASVSTDGPIRNFKIAAE